MTISLTGIPGSGKSTVGRELASVLGWAFIDLDEHIVSRTGRNIPEMFSEGEDVFRAEEKTALLEILEASGDDRNMVLALGGGTICGDEQVRQAILTGTSCFWLRIDPDTALSRIPDLSTRPMLAAATSDGTLYGLLAGRERFYRQAHFHLPCDDLSPDEIAASIIALLGL